jgi:hypothetical protein
VFGAAAEGEVVKVKLARRLRQENSINLLTWIAQSLNVAVPGFAGEPVAQCGWRVVKFL